MFPYLFVSVYVFKGFFFVIFFICTFCFSVIGTSYLSVAPALDESLPPTLICSGLPFLFCLIIAPPPPHFRYMWFFFLQHCMIFFFSLVLLKKEKNHFCETLQSCLRSFYFKGQMMYDESICSSLTYNSSNLFFNNGSKFWPMVNNVRTIC